MRFRTPVLHATVLLLASGMIYGCSGSSGGGGDSIASGGPIPIPTSPPLARFSATPISGSAALTVQFTNESSLGSEVLANYIWIFGDGGSSVEESPLYTYQIPGFYT